MRFKKILRQNMTVESVRWNPGAGDPMFEIKSGFETKKSYQLTVSRQIVQHMRRKKILNSIPSNLLLQSRAIIPIIV